MEIKDYSYGIIPLIKEEDGWKIFLINQYGHTGDVYWTFPKGHAEGEESPLQAALRELFEETGLTIEKPDEALVYKQEYSFKDGENVINKTVVYYRGVASSSAFHIQEDEVKEAGWFTPQEALLKLTFEPSKEILVRALASLQE